MTTETKASALEALLADYDHLNWNVDDREAMAVRAKLVKAARDERRAMVAALRECAKRLDAAVAIIADLNITSGMLKAAAKARKALGE